MKFMKDGYKKLKEEVEKTYPCLGLTHAEVGVYQKSGSNLGDMTVCTDPSPPSVSDLVAAGAAADTYANPASFKAIAGYIPSSDVVAHNKVDLDMQEINNAVGDALFADALFVYENGGGGKNSDGTAIGNSLKSSGIRYLMGFADNTKMGAEKWYNVYKNYWKSTGMTDVQAAKYSDTNVRPAFEGTGAFSGATVSDKMRAEVAKKGVAYQVVWMYVLHEYEDAIMDCLLGDIALNDAGVGGAAPHAWDEGWAFYAGSLEGEVAGDSSTDGVMVYKLANKRCENFGTCKDGATGVAKANLKHLALARNGRDKILAGECHTVAEDFDAIVDQMTIPLIQGMLKYAYESDPAAGAKCASTGDDCDKALGEAWAFAAAVLPRLNYCDSSVAKLVKDNLDVTVIAGATASGDTQMTDGYAKLKEQVETTYPCLGITCEEVGVYQTTAGVAKGGMSVCTDPTTTSAALDLVAEGLKADKDTISSGETAIAGYIPSSNVVPHSKVDLDMAEINTAVGSGDFATALFVYESGGGGKCTDALITANTGFGSPDACVAGSLDGAVGNSLKSSEIRRLFKFATSTSMKAERWC